MNSWTTTLGLWLADFSLLATCLLLFVSIAAFFIRQPVQRMAMAWGAMIGLVLLAVVCSLPTWPRAHFVAGSKDEAGSDSPAVSNGRQHVTASPVVAGPDAPVRGRTEEHFPSADFDEPAKVSPPVSVESLQQPAVPPPSKQRLVMGFAQWMTVLAHAFAAGSAIVALWLVWGRLRMSGLCRRAIPAPAAIVAELLEIVGTGRRAPRLLLCSEIVNAVAVGIVRPTIVLPSRFAEEEHRDGLPLVLAHEWAHIQNRDLWLLAVHRILLIVLFAHPLYWWLQRRISDDQEALADAAAASRTNSTDYAMKLLSWARLSLNDQTSSVTAALGIWEHPSQFSRRITMLLDENFRVTTSCPRRWRYTFWGLTGMLALSLSVLTIRPPQPASAGDPAESQAASANDGSPAQKEKPAVAHDNQQTSERANPPAEQVAANGETLSGTVVDPDGKPVAQAMILLSSRDNFFKDYGKNLIPRTNEKGEFRIEYVTPGLHKITAFSPNWGLKTVKVSSPLTKPLRISLKKGTRVEFRAVDEAGEPISGIAFHPQAPQNIPFTGDDEINYLHVLDFLSHRYLIGNRTNKEGVFVWKNAPTETLGYQIYGEGYLSHMGDDFGPKGSPHMLVFRNTIPVMVTVTDAETGKPIRDFEVFHGTRFKSNPPSVGWSWSHRHVDQKVPGEFTEQIRNLDRVTRYRIQAKGYRLAISRILDAEKLPEEPVSLSFPLTRDTGFAGTLLQPDGSPAVGAKLYTKTRNTRDYEGLQISHGVADETNVTTVVESGSKGEFRIAPHDQPFVCFISHDSGYAERMDAELLEQAAIQLKPWSKVEGRVLRRGKPAAQIAVGMRRPDYSQYDSEFPGVSHFQQVRTDAEGEFRFSKCVDGEWSRTITWDDPMAGASAYHQTSRYVITAGQTVVDSFGTNGADLIGKVQLPNQVQIDFSSSVVYLNRLVEARGKTDAAEEPGPSRRVLKSWHQIQLPKDGSFRFFNVVPADHELRISIVVRQDGVVRQFFSNELNVTRKMFAGKTTENPIDLGVIEAKAVVQH